MGGKGCFVLLALAAGCARGATSSGPSSDASAAPSAPSTAAPTTEIHAAAPREVVIAAVGDVMLGDAPNDRVFDDVGPILREADVAFANLEGPLFDGTLSPVCTPFAVAEKHKGSKGDGSCWSFRMPTRVAGTLRDAGFDVLSLANNHALDFGEPGRASTIAALEGAGLAYAGPNGHVAHLSIGATRVDVIAFGTDAGPSDLHDLDAARTLVARCALEADVVVVSFHGGAEGPTALHVPDAEEFFWGEPRGAVKAFAHAMIDAGADLVLGHGPHVVRGLELRRGRLIAYSLGSFATLGAIDVRGVRGTTLVLEARLRADGAFAGGRIVPIVQRPPGGPRLDPKKEVIPLLQSLDAADFPATGAPLDTDGALDVP